MEETWKDVLGYEGVYRISNLGRVFSSNYGGKLLKPCLVKGYYQIKLSKKNLVKWHKVHRLVATHFIPNPKNSTQVNHIDSDKENNNVNNLEWCTSKENQHHAIKSGRLKVVGQDNPNAKLTNSQVIEIREKYRTGKYRQVDLSKEYHVTQVQISTILLRKQRKDI